MLDELLEIFERDRENPGQPGRRRGWRAKLARLIGGGDDRDDSEGRHEHDGDGSRRRDRDRDFDLGD